MDTHRAAVMITAQKRQVLIAVNPGPRCPGVADAGKIPLQQGKIHLVQHGQFNHFVMGFERVLTVALGRIPAAMIVSIIAVMSPALFPLPFPFLEIGVMRILSPRGVRRVMHKIGVSYPLLMLRDILSHMYPLSSS